MSSAAQKAPSKRRIIQFATMIVVGASFGGFYVGTREAAYRAPDTAAPASVVKTEEPVGISEAVSYTDIPARERGPNADWPRGIREMADELPVPAEPVTDPAVKEASLVARSEQRAYNGAPPVIPHPAANMNGLDCLICHEDGLQLGEQFAPAMSHEFHVSCTQCHAPTMNPILSEAALEIPNIFRGIPAPPAGDRAWEGAPPVVPHSTNMRQNCLACHGVKGWPGLHTTHPERQNCYQCHATQAPLEQHVASERLTREGTIGGD